MLRSNNLSIAMTVGSKPIPAGMEIIGKTGVVDATNGNSGLLIRSTATGIYRIYNAFGSSYSVDQRAAKTYAEQ